MNDYEKRWLLREVTPDGLGVDEAGETNLLEPVEREARQVSDTEYIVKVGCFRMPVHASVVYSSRDAAVARIGELYGGKLYERPKEELPAKRSRKKTQG